MVGEIFSFSELGFQEIETSRYVTGILEQEGFKVERGIAKIPTAWMASYGNGNPVIAFIAVSTVFRARRKNLGWRTTTPWSLMLLVMAKGTTQVRPQM